jgi:hypothetical protein
MQEASKLCGCEPQRLRRGREPPARHRQRVEGCRYSDSVVRVARIHAEAPFRTDVRQELRRQVRRFEVERLPYLDCNPQA